jgi:hypothetical protein
MNMIQGFSRRPLPQDGLHSQESKQQSMIPFPARMGLGSMPGWLFRALPVVFWTALWLDPLDAAVVYQNYPLPLGVNTLGRDNGQGPGYLIGGTIYRFDWRAAPADFDFDGNGAVDLTIAGNGHTEPASTMYVTQHGRNQVWSLAGGAAGLDFGTHALALLGGSIIGPSLQSDNPRIGWHNEDDTQGYSALMTSVSGTPASGTFFPTTLFEQKYLGFRFEREGGLHYGWIALSGYAFYGQEIYVYSWAYESEPDTALAVGQIPEPTVPALLGLGLWFGMKRRKPYRNASPSQASEN